MIHRVFLLEGLATILFSGVIYLVLPDHPKSPRSSSWLTPEEQEYLELRLPSNAPRTHDPVFSKYEILASIKDPRIVGFTLSQFLLNIAGYGLSWQLPTITTSLGFAGLPRNQLLNIPPASVTVLSTIGAAWFLRRAVIVRPLFIQLLTAGTLAFFVVLCLPVSRGATYTACVLGTALYFTYFVPFWAWRGATLAGSTGAAFTLEVGGRRVQEVLCRVLGVCGRRGSIECVAVVLDACLGEGRATCAEAEDRGREGRSCMDQAGCENLGGAGPDEMTYIMLLEILSWIFEK